MNKKKVLITSRDLNVGGIQTTLVRLLNKIDYDAIEVDLFLLETNGILIDQIPKEVNINSLDDYILSKLLNNRLIQNLASCSYLKKNFKIPNKFYDVAIAFDGYNILTDTFAGIVNASNKIIWVHSDYYHRKNDQIKFKILAQAMKKKYYLFEKIICVSKSAMNGFKKVFPGYEKNLLYIWNMVTVDSDTSKEVSMEMSQDSFKILAVGSLLKVKGYDLLVLIHSELISLGYKVETYILGEGPERESLETIINKYGVSDSFHLIGQTQDVELYMKNSDLLVSTSLYEGLPTVLIESLGTGLPIVAPNVSGCRDVIQEIAPANAALLAERTLESMVSNIITVIENKESFEFSFDIDQYNQLIWDRLCTELFNKEEEI